jgi:parvulin-like peptidyl-prolyl isomerase
MRHLLILMAALAACTGCDLLDPAKVGDPVFGPAPPRKIVKGGPTDKDAKTPDNIATNNDPIPSGWDAANAVTTARGSSPDKAPAQTVAAVPDGDIKRTGFTGGKSAEGKLTGNEIIASVNGQPIFASEIFERAGVEALTSDGLSLLVANRALAAKQITEPEVRQLQLLAIRKYGKDYVRTRVLSQAMIGALEKEQQKKIDDAVNKEWENYLDKLKRDFNVLTAHEVEQGLRKQGTSLLSLKEEFKNRLLADEYLRGKSKKEHIVGREEILAFYEQHADDFSFPEKVHWQLLEINFEKHGGRNGALTVLSQVIDALKKGQSFDKVARKYSDGPRAEDGGKQPWTRAESVVDEKTSKVLQHLAVGETSPVLSGQTSYRLVRMMERKPAGRKPLADVQEVIKQILEEQIMKEGMRKVLVEAYQKASIESAYLPPEDLQPPADFAGIPATDKKTDASVKKGRRRS